MTVALSSPGCAPLEELPEKVELRAVVGAAAAVARITSATLPRGVTFPPSAVELPLGFGTAAGAAAPLDELPPLVLHPG